MWVQTASSEKYVPTSHSPKMAQTFLDFWRIFFWRKNISHQAINSQKSTPFFSLLASPPKKRCSNKLQQIYRYYTVLIIPRATSLRGRFKSRSPRAEETTTPGSSQARISAGNKLSHEKKPGWFGVYRGLNLPVMWLLRFFFSWPNPESEALFCSFFGGGGSWIIVYLHGSRDYI